MKLNVTSWTEAELTCLKHYWHGVDPWNIHDMLTEINPPARSWPDIKKKAKELGLGKGA